MLDITGGEPELYPHLRELISLARGAGLAVRVRTNLVALAAPEAAGLAAYFADHGVALLASLPGVSATQTVEQRGSEAVWRTSVEVLLKLSELGYGTGDSLALEIAYNPPLGQLRTAPKARSRASSVRPSNRWACASTHCSRCPTCRSAGIGSV